MKQLLQLHSVFKHQTPRFHCIVPALIGALGTIGAGAIAATSQARQNKQNLATAKDLASYQWNNFGSPQAQKNAYQAAGINPFAQGQISADSPQMSVPDQQAPGVVFGSALQSFIAPFAQLLAVNSQIKNLQAQTEQTQTATEGIQIDNDLKRFDLGEIKPQQLRLLMSQISSTDAGRELTRAQTKQIAYNILKTQAETQGIDLRNRFQEMENEWKKIQGDKKMPENLAEWQRLQNERITQQMQIDAPGAEIAQVRTKLLKSLEKCFDQINSTNFKPNSNFMGIPLTEDTLPFIRAIVNMLLYKVVVSF